MVWLMLLLRLCSAVVWLLAGTVATTIVGLGELQALCLGARNAWTAKKVDTGIGACLVPLSYIVGGMMLQGHDRTSVAFEWIAATFGVLLIATRWYLGRSYSVCEPTYERIVDQGPYRVVRHPIAALHLAMRFALLCAWPSWWNAYAVAICCCTAMIAIMLEERFLSQVSNYEEYATRVRWRIIPFVC